MKLLTLLCLFTSVLAHYPSGVHIVPRASPLEVTVESVGNSALKASITNRGSAPLKLLIAGSILDDRAIERAEIYSGTDQIDFEGVRLSISKSNLSEAAFQTLQPGETVVNEWDPASVHDLSSGGDLDFVIRGSFLIAEAGSTDLSDEIPYISTVKSTVNGTAAAKVRRSFIDFIEKRSKVQNDCTGERGQAQFAALDTCTGLATAAQQAAQSGPDDKMLEYFNSASASTRTRVAKTFGRIATECGAASGNASSKGSSISTQFCTDVLANCNDQQGILAYTVPSRSIMVSCGIYFNQLPALETRQCHGQDQATTTLHEVTHLRAIEGTNDFAYGYRLATRLDTRSAVENADTYALFANAIKIGC